MNNWIATLAFWVFCIPPVFSTETLNREEWNKAYHGMHKAWRAIESIELSDKSKLIPHAILYDGGTVFDIFLTFSPGFLKFVSMDLDVPPTSGRCWNLNAIWTQYFSRKIPNGSSYRTQDITLPYLGSSPESIRTKIWKYKDPKGDTKIYASERSAVFRLSFTSVEHEFLQQGLADYITNTLQNGIHIEFPQTTAKKVDWRDEYDIITYLVKTQQHKYIKTITRPQFILFQTAVEECRKKRALKKE